MRHTPDIPEDAENRRLPAEYWRCQTDNDRTAQQNLRELVRLVARRGEAL
jgi:hypothetical protein